jgi:hypothetical protein
MLGLPLQREIRSYYGAMRNTPNEFPFDIARSGMNTYRKTSHVLYKRRSAHP